MFIDSLIHIHRSIIGSLVHLLSCSAAHGFFHVISLEFQIPFCSFVDAVHNFNRSWLLNPKNVLANHRFLIVISYFRIFRLGACSHYLVYSLIGQAEPTQEKTNCSLPFAPYFMLFIIAIKVCTSLLASSSHKEFEGPAFTQNNQNNHKRQLPPCDSATTDGRTRWSPRFPYNWGPWWMVSHAKSQSKRDDLTRGVALYFLEKNSRCHHPFLGFSMKKNKHIFGVALFYRKDLTPNTPPTPAARRAPGSTGEFHFHRMDKLKSWAKRVTSNKSLGLLRHGEAKPIWGFPES